MTMHWQIRHGSANRKLGPGAWAVTLDRSTCPASCPLRGAGCYAESGPLRVTWDRVSRGEAPSDGRTRWAGEGFEALASTLEDLPIRSGALLRIGDAGDPSIGGEISRPLVRALVALRQRGVRVILYTHAPDTAENRETIRDAELDGLTINRSTHGVEATRPEEPFAAGERVTTVGPEFWTDGREAIRPNPDGPLIVRCPDEVRAITCEACGLCARSRGFVIGFTTHGTRKRQALESAL